MEESIPKEDRINSLKVKAFQLKCSGFSDIEIDYEKEEIRCYTGEGHKKTWRNNKPSWEDFMAQVNGDREIPWLKEKSDELHKYKPKWEKALPACEANWAKPEGDRNKEIADPGEIMEGIERIEDITYVIDTFLKTDTLTQDQKKFLVSLFRAGMSYREFLNIPARDKNRHGAKFPKGGGGSARQWPDERTMLKNRIAANPSIKTPRDVVLDRVLCNYFKKAGRTQKAGFDVYLPDPDSEKWVWERHLTENGLRNWIKGAR